MRLAVIAGIVVVLVAWAGADLGLPQRHSIRSFDPHEVAELETGMWRSYYAHQPFRLFCQLSELLRRQYSFPFWRSLLGAYYAAQAAVTFQRGTGRSEYEKAIPAIDEFYKLIHQGSEVPFNADRAARLELEWWIVHRERAKQGEEALIRALADLQAEIYRMPAERFREHAEARAKAMLRRDERAAAGQVTDEDWAEIGRLLDQSWTSLHRVVNEQRHI